MYILEKENFLSPKQFGFRRMRGTEDAILVFDTAIDDAIAQKKTYLFAVFFDM